MPDDPIEKAAPTPNPEEKLRDLFDKIEREELKGSTPAPSAIPSNDEIRADVHTSPIESQINMDSIGSHDDPDEEEELSPEDKALKEFDERLKAARGGSMPEPPEWNFQRPNIPGKNKVEENNYLGMGVGISIAYTLVGCTLAGWGLGKLIDMRSGGYLGQAIGTLLGAVIGLVAAIATVIRAQKKPGQ